jgi:hypothetical protein
MDSETLREKIYELTVDPNFQRRIFVNRQLILPQRLLYFDRDEFYAYDDELRIYLGEELYPDYLKY